MKKTKRYPAEIRERSARLVFALMQCQLAVSRSTALSLTQAVPQVIWARLKSGDEPADIERIRDRCLLWRGARPGPPLEAE
jgi:hypothetical protein